MVISSSLFSQQLNPVADSLIDELASAKPDSNKVNLLIEICNEVSYYDLNKALNFGLEGIELSEKIKYPLGTSRMKSIMGFVYLDMGDYNASTKMLDEAEAIAIEQKNIELLGKINNSRGNFYFMQSDMYNASYYYTKAAESFHSIRDTAREIAATQNMIATLGEVKNYKKAITISKQLLEILKFRNDSLQMGYALNHLVVNELALRDTTEAIKYIPQLLTIIQNTTDLGLAADSYNVIGDYFFATKNYDSAISYYQTALTKSLRISYQPAQYNLSLGNAYLQKGQLSIAIDYLNNAIRLSEESNSRDIYYRACLPLSEYYSRINDYKNAYKYSTEYAKLNDSILVAETRQYTSYLEASFENDKKEKKITHLELTNTQKELAVVKRNRLLLFGGICASALLIILSLFVRSNRQKRIIAEKDQVLKGEQIKFLERQQQVVSLQSMVNGQETERTRIAKDLHDGLGGLFSTIKMHFSSLQHENQDLKNNPLFAKSYDMVDTASEEVRRIAHNMMPEVLIKMGLIQASKELCNSISAGKLLQASLQAYGMGKRLNSSTEIMLFRIIQELLNNIIKHANATEAIIQFNRDENRLSVTVEDNGCGFNLKETDDKKHAGLESVQSRVTYLNGKLSIDSQQEVGTTVMMEFLINE